MEAYSISVFYCEGESPWLLAHVEDVSSFNPLLARNRVHSYLVFSAREVIRRTVEDVRQSVHADKQGYDFMCHTFRSENLGCAVITDRQYSPSIAHRIVQDSLRYMIDTHGHDVGEGTTSDTLMACEGLRDLLKKYNHPGGPDKISEIQSNLKETTDITVKNIEQILERGERLEYLFEQTEDLSHMSKAFARKTKKLNRCCTVM